MTTAWQIVYSPPSIPAFFFGGTFLHGHHTIFFLYPFFAEALRGKPHLPIFIPALSVANFFLSFFLYLSRRDSVESHLKSVPLPESFHNHKGGFVCPQTRRLPQNVSSVEVGTWAGRIHVGLHASFAGMLCNLSSRKT